MTPTHTPLGKLPKSLRFALLTDRRFHPRGHDQSLTPQELWDYACDMYTEDTPCWYLETPSLHLLWIDKETPWDSTQLGFCTARVELCCLQAKHQVEPPREALAEALDSVLVAALENLRTRGCQYLIARVPAQEFAIQHRLQARRFVLLDGLLQFSIDLTSPDANAPLEEDGLLLREAQPEDLASARALAAQAFRLDRFHVDPLIPQPQADALHQIWIENAWARRAADQVWIAQAQGQLAGFVTGSINTRTRRLFDKTTGSVGLIAIEHAFRNKGIATALTRYSFAGFRRLGVQTLEIGTQLANLAAQHTYRKAGLRPVSSSLTFRRWLDP